MTAGITAVLDGAITALALGSTVVGGYIGYQAYRAYRRHDSHVMRLLSVGLFLLTAVAFTTAFVGSVALRQGLLDGRFQRPLTLVTRTLPFLGVLVVAYSLHARE